MGKMLVTLSSGNAKLGRMAATYRLQDTCPTTCPFYGNGCYARGRIFSIPRDHGKDDAEANAALVALIDTMPQDYVLRLNVSGDFLTVNGSPDIAYIAACNAVATARPDVTIIAYTHAWRVLSPDMFTFTVAASCESGADIAEAIAEGWSPVTVDPGTGQPGSLLGETVAGRRVVQCPQQKAPTRVTCASCRACAKADRPVIAFVAHGMGAKKASDAVAGLR